MWPAAGRTSWCAGALEYFEGFWGGPGFQGLAPPYPPGSPVLSACEGGDLWVGAEVACPLCRGGQA